MDDERGRDDETQPDKPREGVASPPDERSLAALLADLHRGTDAHPANARSHDTPHGDVPAARRLDDLLRSLAPRPGEADPTEGSRLLGDSDRSGPGASLNALLRDLRADHRDTDVDDGRSRPAGSTAPATPLEGDATGPAGHPALSPAVLREPTSILLLDSVAPTEHSTSCQPFFAATAAPQQHVLSVTLTRPVDERLGLLETVQPPPAAVTIVSATDHQSSAGTAQRQAFEPAPTIRTLSTPADLSRLGIAISKTVAEWPATAPISICVHSLTTLLQYAELERVFRFLHLLQGQFEGRDVTAHFHIDRDAHDDQTVATLATLFDLVVEQAADGHLTVRE